MEEFLTTSEELAVVDEIRIAESATSAEIRVVITNRWILRTERHARRLFLQLGMHRTALRNGVLIVLFARRRRFAVLGDGGINAVVDPGYWERLAGVLSSHLHDGDKSGALIEAIRTLAATMASHFPPGDDNPDELPNAVHRD